MNIWDEVALIESTEIRDIPVSSPLEPNRLLDAGRYHGYLLGCNTQEDYETSLGSTIVAWYGGERGQAFAINQTIAHAVRFNYLKPAHGYKGPKASYLAMINATARRLDLPAYTRKSEFDANCVTFKTWVDSLDFRGAATTGVSGSWGEVGVSALVVARSIGQCYHVIYGQTIPINHVYATVKHGRNAYGVVFGYDTFSDLGQANYPLVEHSYHVSNGYALSGYPGDVETPEGPSLQELLNRRSRLYEYLRLQNLQQTGGSEPQSPSGGGSNIMPWLSILFALLTFFMSGGSKKENRTKALAAAALAGVGTYYVSHETEWGQRTLGELDGYVAPGIAGTPLLDNNGDPVSVNGSPIIPPVVTSSSGSGNSGGLWDVLKTWGPTGTAAVVGVGGAAITGKTNWLLIGLLGLGAVLLLK